MTRIARIAAAAAIPLAALATAAQAQLAGIPVYFDPRGGTGVGVAANLGFPDNNGGSGTAYGVAGSIGTGPVTVSAMVGAWKATSYNFPSAQTTYGANISYRLFGGGILPVAVAVQAGYGAYKNALPAPAPQNTISTIPVGVGISFNPPLFPLKPWIAPRMDFISGGGSSTSQFRVSGGVNFNLLLGLGVHAAVDYKPSSPTSMIIGVGAHFNFHVPM
jgi:hypothetical protein